MKAESLSKLPVIATSHKMLGGIRPHFGGLFSRDTWLWMVKCIDTCKYRHLGNSYFIGTTKGARVPGGSYVAPVGLGGEKSQQRRERFKLKTAT